MNKFQSVSVFITILFCFSILSEAQTRARKDFNLPDILGYKTLRCDFHTHTVFSDGNVWPNIRSEEAWREGLDVIAITDHIEYQPHKHDLKMDFNRSHEIAKPAGDALDILVIRGGEITRSMPPGHFNGVFMDDVSKLKLDAWEDAFKAAAKQDAFIFWNHPGWKGQQADGVPKWYEEHTWLYENGYMQGIEVVNEREYYPLAHQWCIDKNLTMMSNSDIHDPIQMDYELHARDFRPMTLVFAKEKSERAVKEALRDRRTVVYSNNMLAGDEKYLKPLFYESLSIDKKSFEIKGKNSVNVMIKNNSDIDFFLIGKAKVDEVSFPKELTLKANRTVILNLRGRSDDRSGTQKISLPFIVENLKTKPGAGMDASFDFNITFVPKEH